MKMSVTTLDPEGYCPASDHPDWNQSIYFNFYDPIAKTGGFIRMGLLENRDEANMWFVLFRDGRPLFSRLNMNLPYTKNRLKDGVTLAGVTLKSTRPMEAATLSFEHKGFKADLNFDAILPMQDCINLSKTGEDDGFAKELTNIHPEGTCAVTGQITLQDGETITIDGKGFRDLSVGPRNWDYMRHYRLAWPIFDNGLSVVAVHGITTTGADAWMRMVGKNGKWIAVTHIEDRNVFEDDCMTIKSMHWKVTDADGDVHEFTGRPLYRWMFPLDTFVLTEHMIEYTLADGTKGYGLGECGFRFPWAGNGED
jgi:hypothetical protein